MRKSSFGLVIALGVLFFSCSTIAVDKEISSFEKISLKGSRNDIYAALQDWFFLKGNDLDLDLTAAVKAADRESGVFLVDVDQALGTAPFWTLSARYKLKFKVKKGEVSVALFFVGTVEKPTKTQVMTITRNVFGIRRENIENRYYPWAYPGVWYPREINARRIENRADALLQRIKKYLKERFPG